MNKSSIKIFCLIVFVCSFIAPLVVQGADEKPWAKAEEDVDVYHLTRKPAAVPLRDTEVINRIGKFIVIQDSKETIQAPTAVRSGPAGPIPTTIKRTIQPPTGLKIVQ